jgi:hypothetical protein
LNEARSGGFVNFFNALSNLGLFCQGIVKENSKIDEFRGGDATKM